MKYSFFYLSFLFSLGCAFEPLPFVCEPGEERSNQKCEKGGWVRQDTNSYDVSLDRSSDLGFSDMTFCGNGSLDANEQCELNLIPTTCQKLGFGGGILTCEDCKIVTAECTVLDTCQNGVLDETELCDAKKLGNNSCESEGFDGGEIACTSDCTLDLSACFKCGDGKINNKGEECDRSEFGAQTCKTRGFDGGRLKCTPTCMIDESGCDSCGDGVIAPNEVCDLKEFAKKTCFSEKGPGYQGELSCASNCKSIDTQFCYLSFQDLSAGDSHTCGLKTDGKVVCWGKGDEGQTISPPGKFTQLSAGSHHNCALSAGGQATCWGRNDENQATSPPLRFNQISAGGYHTCGIKLDGKVVCWGSDEDNQSTLPLAYQNEGFDQISAGGFHTCGITSGLKIVCWGASVGEMGQDSFLKVSSGGYFSCGIKSNREVQCSGSNKFGQLGSPGGSFAQLEAGDFHSCVLSDLGSPVCWGRTEDGRTNPPSLFYQKISAGGSHTCGLNANGTITCWGSNESGQSLAPLP